MAEFTTSLTNFQKTQRQAAEREKEFVARVRASSRVSVSIVSGIDIVLMYKVEICDTLKSVTI